MRSKLLIFLFSVFFFFGLKVIDGINNYLNSMEEMALLVALENEDFQENEENSKEIKDGYDENINIYTENKFIFIFFNKIQNHCFHFLFSASGFVPGLISPPPEG